MVRSFPLAGVIAMVAALPRIAAGQPCAYDFSSVDDYLNQLVSAVPLDGAALLVEKDGVTIHQQVYGAYTLDTVVPIASATKWVSGTVVMALVDSGVLTLDDTTGQWLGWQGEKGEITLRQLMSHTSGIDRDDAPCISDRFTTLAACVDEIYQLPLIAPPGTEFHYGGNSMQVAGRMCEVAAGQPWVTLYEQYVRGTLQMTRAQYGSLTNPRIAGGMSSDLNSYGNLLRMYAASGAFNGTTVLSPAAVETALRDQTGDAVLGYIPPCRTLFDAPAAYGIGNWVDALSADGASLQNSSPGAFSFHPWYDPGRGLIGVLLVYVDQQSNYVCDNAVVLRGLIEAVVDARTPGDANCDGRIDFFDVDPWLAGLFALPGRYLQVGGSGTCWQNRVCWGDVNGDGAFDNFDIDPFVALLFAQQ